MKRLCIILILFKYAFCRSFETDLASSRYDLLTGNLEAIHQDDITLLVYTKADTTGATINLTDANTLTEVSSFNTELKTVFYIHGWQDTVIDESSTLITKALLENADVNIIIVNWDKCANSIDYFVSQRCVPDAGKYIGQFIETIAHVYSYSLSDITVVGHSLGAHIAGYIGKYSNGTLGTIVGLDPAGPFYSKNKRSARLTEDDAQYVQAIHTDGLFLGVNFNVGHSDFWPNGGLKQIGCGLNAECSHINAYKYYAESVTNNAFMARNCDSFDDFEKRKCIQNTKSLMGGVNVNTSAFGNFYLETNPQSPFGMGDVS